MYHTRLGFLTSVNSDEIHIRTSTAPRTQQVASSFLSGMDSSSAHRSWPVYTQPDSVSQYVGHLFLRTNRLAFKIDSLVPSYPCPAANAIRNNYQSVPAWTDHLIENVDLKDRLDSILGTAGLEDWASWCKCKNLQFTKFKSEQSFLFTKMIISLILLLHELVMGIHCLAIRLAHVLTKMMHKESTP